MRRIISAALVLIFGLHSFSVHGFADTLVYCFESDGDINIESTSTFSFGFKSDCELHSLEHDKHSGVEYHASSNSCKDVELSETCIEDNRINRFDQELVFQVLAWQNDRLDGYLVDPVLNIKKAGSPPFFKPVTSKSLQSVILII